MKKEKNDFISQLHEQFKGCANPPNYKEAIIAKVVTAEPLSLHIDGEKNLLIEGENLLISEGFRFRCNIDKTTALSVDVVNALNSANSINIQHTNGSSCVTNGAIDYLITAITKINSELLAYKCDLKIGDYVIICPTEISEKYIVIEKVL